MEGFLDEAGPTHMKQLEALGRVFEKAAEADTPSEVSRVHGFLYLPFPFMLFLLRKISIIM